MLSIHEHLLPAEVQAELRRARAVGLRMGIHPQQIFAHKHSLPDELTPEENRDEKGHIWYASSDVGKAAKQVIPRAVTDGFKRDDEFSEALFNLIEGELQHLYVPGFDVQTFAADIKEFTKDPNLIQYLLCGVPQSYCGRFETVFHNNLPMSEPVVEKIRARRDKQVELDNCSGPLTRPQLLKILSKVLSNPAGAVLKNRAERLKFNAGEEAKYRPIYHGSKEKDGQSLNSQTHTNHDVQFVRFQDIEAAILRAVDRVHELGFKSHFNRVRVWKSDISDAYRIVRTAIADHWLGVWGLCEKMPDGSRVMKYVIEKAQQFGQRKSVTIFSRLVYQITSIMSQPGWAQKWFPEMSLEEWDGQASTQSRPSEPDIASVLKKFRDAVEGKGILDPHVFFWMAYYLDDCHGISIDVRSDISLPLEADPDTGIRNPIGKAISFFLNRYGIQENIEKRILENDELLMGGTDVITLGIRIDVNALRCYVREDYRAELLIDISHWMSNPSKCHSAEEWGSMEGRLGFCMIVYPNFRSFMRDIWRTYAAILNHNQPGCCASKVILENLEIIRTLLDRNPGRSLEHNRQWRTTYQRGLQHCFNNPSIMDLLSDASTSIGFGLVNTNTGEYYFRRWSGKEKELAKRKKIYVLEAAATFIMFKINASYLSEFKLNIIGDNEGLVRSFHSAGSRSSPLVNDIVRLMIIDLTMADIVLNCDKDKFDNMWCDTKEMKAADALSRGAIGEFEEYMENNFPQVQLTCLTTADPRVEEAESQWLSILEKHVTSDGQQRDISTLVLGGEMLR